MGFFRRQEELLAIRYLTWQYQKRNIHLPALEKLESQASRIVDEAHRIGRERGGNILAIIKELISDLRQKK